GGLGGVAARRCRRRLVGRRSGGGVLGGIRGGGRSRRSCSLVCACGFLLRAGRQHQRGNDCAKSKFGFHRSVPRREARVVWKRRRPVGIVPHPVPVSAESKFYRSPGTIGNCRTRALSGRGDIPITRGRKGFETCAQQDSKRPL